MVMTLCPQLEKLNISRNRFVELRFDQSWMKITDLDASENEIEKIINFGQLKNI